MEMAFYFTFGLSVGLLVRVIVLEYRVSSIKKEVEQWRRMYLDIRKERHEK